MGDGRRGHGAAHFPEPGELVVKDGATGATAFAGGEAAFEPSLPVEVVDAVGAGDAFAGGYLAALLGGAPLRTGCGRATSGPRSRCGTTGDSLQERELA